MSVTIRNVYETVTQCHNRMALSGGKEAVFQIGGGFGVLTNDEVRGARLLCGAPEITLPLTCRE